MRRTLQGSHISRRLPQRLNYSDPVFFWHPPQCPIWLSGDLHRESLRLVVLTRGFETFRVLIYPQQVPVVLQRCQIVARPWKAFSNGSSSKQCVLRSGAPGVILLHVLCAPS